MDVRAPHPVYFVSLLDGECTIGVEPLDTSWPAAVSFWRDQARLVLTIPDHLLRPRLTDPDDVARRVVRGDAGLGALLSSYVAAFARAELPEPAVGGATDVLLDLLALAWNTSPRATAAPATLTPAGVREARRRAIRDHVERHLGDPALRPAAIAAHFRISPRYLDDLFAEAGTSVMRHVMARRLDRARAALIDPDRRDRSITEVALGLGFQDPSHFGRAFKAAYGVTPRDWRRRGA
jgi:AraC-like DNA-binding protein